MPLKRLVAADNHCASNEHWPTMLAGEFIGTMILVFWGTSTVAAAVILNSFTSVVHAAALWGIGVTMAIYFTRGLSCAHLNPAVTLAMIITGRMRPKLLPCYWSGQLLGAITGGLLTFLVFHEAITQFETVHQIVRGAPESVKTAMIFGEYFPNPVGGIASFKMTIESAMLIEGLGTLLLVTVILAITETCQLRRHHEYLTPIWIGTTVAAIISIFAPFTQAGINPARDMGPRMVAYFSGWAEVAIPGPHGGFLLVYCLAPLVGGGIAAVAHRYLIERIIRHSGVPQETVSGS